VRESLLSVRCDLTRDVCGSLIVVLVLEVIAHPLVKATALQLVFPWA